MPRRDPRRPRARSPLATLAVVAVALVALLAVSTGCTADERWRAEALGGQRLLEDRSFYDWSDDDLEGEPGTLVRAERILGAPEGATAWRVLFRSRDVHDDPAVVSGVVLTPDGSPRGGGDRAVVSWGHPTMGAAQHCAPSLGVDPFVLIEGATDLLGDGYTVVASDYPGMGAAGPWAYLIGASEGRSVLDAARAARALPEAHAGNDVVLWGHSQGGHAALFAARQASAYAPDLDVAGVAVAAPAVELAELLADDIGDSAGVALGSYAFWAYDRTYARREDPPRLQQILTGEGAAATEPMAARCLIGQHVQLHRIADPLVGHYLRRAPTDVPSWAQLLRENTPTAAPYDMAVFVAQGEEDTLVRPGTTARYVERLCRSGQAVQFRRDPAASHLTVAERALPDVRRFAAAALDGRRPPDTCDADS